MNRAIDLGLDDADARFNRGIARSRKGLDGLAASDYCRTYDMNPAVLGN
ncbi:MAG: hypothetical protein A4E57_02982 [Syntrophorhabdaceae bacterium PtaU1.Bin034]|nr:MAG: hypothetical protein A4E57_02982 [Syntrophorhabdaceae bacterium PtaU1.Bin034]